MNAFWEKIKNKIWVVSVVSHTCNDKKSSFSILKKNFELSSKKRDIFMVDSKRFTEQTQKNLVKKQYLNIKIVFPSGEYQ
jgi:hypothetical protein